MNTQHITLYSCDFCVIFLYNIYFWPFSCLSRFLHYFNVPLQNLKKFDYQSLFHYMPLCTYMYRIYPVKLLCKLPVSHLEFSLHWVIWDENTSWFKNFEPDSVVDYWLKRSVHDRETFSCLNFHPCSSGFKEIEYGHIRIIFWFLANHSKSLMIGRFFRPIHLNNWIGLWLDLPYRREKPKFSVFSTTIPVPGFRPFLGQFFRFFHSDSLYYMKDCWKNMIFWSVHSLKTQMTKFLGQFSRFFHSDSLCYMKYFWKIWYFKVFTL